MSNDQLNREVGEIHVTVNIMKDVQEEQTKDIKRLVASQNKSNVKVAGISGTVGAITGFLASLVKL